MLQIVPTHHLLVQQEHFITIVSLLKEVALGVHLRQVLLPLQ